MRAHLDPDNLPAGEMVDGWRVVRQLGGGAYGTVYEVEKGGESYALKIARHREHSLDARHTDERAQRELSCLLTLRHRHIARVWAHGRWPHPREGFFYVVMDLVKGYTLDEWVERTRVTPHELVVLFDQVMEAVAYMHGQGILHRDLKPGNILVEANTGEPVVVDYGVAHFPVPAAPRLTDTRLPPGTPRYTSPEALRFESQHRHDKAARYEFKVADELYALGVTLYDLLTDPRPHSRPQPEPLWPCLVPAHEVNERVPAPLSHFASRLLALKPEQRPVSVEAARRDLPELIALQAEQWMKRPLHALLAEGPAAAVPVKVEKVASAPRAVESEQLVPGPALAVEVAPVEVAPVVAELSLGEAHPLGAPRALPRRRGAPARTWGLAALGLGILLVCGAYLSLRGSAPAPQEPAVPAALEARLSPRAPPAEEKLPASPATPPPPSALPQQQPLASQPVSSQEKGPTVKARSAPSAAAPSPCSQKQAPPRGSAAWRAWCQCAGLVGTLAALQAGCTGPQVRPASAPCPQEVRDAYAELKLKSGDGVFVRWNDEGKELVWVKEGPVTSVVTEGDLPAGTLLFGELKIDDPDEGHARIRYTLAQFPNGKKYPVCMDSDVQMQHHVKAGAIEAPQPFGVGIDGEWFGPW